MRLGRSAEGNIAAHEPEAAGPPAEAGLAFVWGPGRELWARFANRPAPLFLPEGDFLMTVSLDPFSKDR